MATVTPIFVRVPKTGSTSVVSALFGGENITHQRASELPDGLGTFRFGFVRNPYTRCLSGYNWMRQHITSGWGRQFHDLSFSEWVVRHLDLTLGGFEPQSDFFDAPVDFIGRFERIEEDFRYIADAIGMSGVSLPHLNATVPNDLSVYNDAAIRAVSAAYAKDLERFGYSWQH